MTNLVRPVREVGEVGEVRPVRIEPLSLSRRLAWETLYGAYADFYRVPRLSAARLELLWGWLTDPSDAMRGLVAVEEGGENGGDGTVGKKVGTDGTVGTGGTVGTVETIGTGGTVGTVETVGTGGTVGKGGKDEVGGRGGRGGRGGEVLGLAHFCVQRNPLRAARLLYLHDLYVLPSARGLGIGGRLVGAVAEVARAEGCLRVRWATHAENARAQKLYDKLAKRTSWVIYDLQP